MRVLLAEDEPKLGDYIRKGLSESGFQVDLVRNGLEARTAALGGGYDILVLDIMLPGLDGFAILDAVRKRSTVPVLMLTARDGVEDRVRGLQAGADDYLSKPFAFTELVARLQALLRRGKLQEITQYGVADLLVDLVARRATRDGQRLDLTAKEFGLLTLLIRRTGQIVSRTVLAEQVWGMNYDSETNVVEVAVRRLRSKLDDPYDRKLLHTVRGMGYVLEDRG